MEYVNLIEIRQTLRINTKYIAKCSVIPVYGVVMVVIWVVGVVLGVVISVDVAVVGGIDASV